MSSDKESKIGELDDNAIAALDEATLTLSQLGIHSVDMLKDMLRRENDLRLSREVQDQYRSKGYGAYVEVTEAVQKQVCDEFGLSEVKGTKALQCADFLVSSAADKAEITEISLYRKYNRVKNGKLAVGMKAPDISKPLFNLDGSAVRFRDLVSQDIGTQSFKELPTLILASSHS